MTDVELKCQRDDRYSMYMYIQGGCGCLHVLVHCYFVIHVQVHGVCSSPLHVMPSFFLPPLSLPSLPLTVLPVYLLPPICALSDHSIFSLLLTLPPHPQLSDHGCHIRCDSRDPCGWTAVTYAVTIKAHSRGRLSQTL